MTIARGAALAALVIVIGAVAYFLLQGSTTGTYRLEFQNAGQLVKGDDVQVAGYPVGSVNSIALAPNNHAIVTITTKAPYAPLHEGTNAQIRATSLSGIANRYVALSPGPNNRPRLADNAMLGTDKTTTIVDLDQIFNTLNPTTRRNLQQVFNGTQQQFKGREAQANAAAHYLSPALSTTDQLVQEIGRDQGSLTRFLVNTSKATGAIAERAPDLTNLVTNSNTTFRAIGNQNVALSRSLGLLPGTLRNASTTFVNLRATLDDLDKLVSASKPNTKRLAEFLRALRPLVTDARPTIRDLRKAIFQPGEDNDLFDVLTGLPRLERTARPAFDNSVKALRRSQPVVQFARPYAPELVGWFRDFGQNPDNYDANGHFARIQPVFNAFQSNNNTLNPIPPSAKLDGLQTRVLRRCPGSASQPPADGSAPFNGGSDAPTDCDPGNQLPGP